MRHSCLVLVVLAMLVLSESTSVDCSRPLQSAKSTGDATREAVRGVKDVQVVSNSVEDRSGQGLAEKQVTTMAAGPSKKGPECGICNFCIYVYSLRGFIDSVSYTALQMSHRIS
ncbi:hypothetical protein Goshw_020773 [Gossypium schwendimanii]|uniref:Secreted protein n=1 Tax=Gossypium schwendimanii TaxID=34291 RepID=A0A7J9NDW7_GOSSC|nr:hypothetical protein [Gossypium schwendimanii]